VAQVEVLAGICGMETQIDTAVLDDSQTVSIKIESSCEHIRKLAAELPEVNAYQEISYRRSMPKTLQLAAECLPHPACPVPSAIIKAIEVAAGLALPKDATIKVSS
jgi:hypothetical protein